MTITMLHVRKARMCSKGARMFFDKHDLNWSSFIKDGICEQLLLDTNDAMAIQVVEVANGR